jgi:hypothetical protein
MYHRHMLGEEDLAHRFDYLFEPISVDDTDVSSDDGAPRAAIKPAADDGSSVPIPSRLVMAGMVLATLAAAAATAIVLLQRPEPANRLDSPVNSTSSSAIQPAAPPQTVAVSPATATASPTDTPLRTAVTQAPPAQRQPPPAQPPPAQPPPAPGQPPATHPPTTRAPISVSPETRTPFPNQNAPRQGGDQPGGLLPGLGLPGPL